MTLDATALGRRREILEEAGLSAETLLYRASLPEHLVPVHGSTWLTASAEAGEAVVDVYGVGHTIVAQDAGPGIALAESSENEWAAPDRTMVAVRLGDVLDQGGLIYPVTSVIIEKVWFCTLPTGRVGARIV
ncbi:MAG: 8-oxo-dGTP pyrophosphatase MutT (NUDIX family) [Kiritimatiellia bacterium]|jgi:8-oxo-dGTP pyrophosphatase MutT (NUDIX family)